MRVLFIRHGQMEMPDTSGITVERINRFFNQEEELGLAAKGRAQAQKVAVALERDRLDAVYASPLLRAVQTADPTASVQGLEVRLSAEVAEIQTGHFRVGSLPDQWVRSALGLPSRTAALLMLAPTLSPLYLASWRAGRTVGGETRADVTHRCRRFFDSLRLEHESDATVAVFSHGYLTLELALSLCQTRAEKMRVWRRAMIPNGSVTEVHETHGRLCLARFAHAEHLR